MERRKILVVDDQKVNRIVEGKILSEYYEVEYAENGREALDRLKESKHPFSGMLLDLVMPEMDGCSVLKYLQNTPEFKNIPVIVVSQADQIEREKMALRYGARDYISKPVDAEILLKRLGNLIDLYESHVHIREMERDTLTGLYNKKAFYEKANEQIRDPSKSYQILSMDIEQFKLMNDAFGTDAGDQMLQMVAKGMEEEMGEIHGLIGRISEGIFGILIEKSEQSVSQIVKRSQELLEAGILEGKASAKFGVYDIVNPELETKIMMECAILASENIKGQYGKSVAYYDDSIRQQLLKEQKITKRMEHAIAAEEFEVYLQPKYELISKKIAGAEALVRWNHPELGLLMPDEFIPIFESNGFISELDYYVWDKTAEMIASWIHRGDIYVPVSVNVSRKDFYRPDLTQQLLEIVDRHGIRPEILHLEITESAYTDNLEELTQIVEQLKSHGFELEMDDFGKGYSSLNMLSVLPINVLKLDMAFIQNEKKAQNNRNILSFIISLAKWMNLWVVAEGVETKEQVDMLKNMDCNYVQGYYFAHPMTFDDFTEILFHSELATPKTFQKKDWTKGTVLLPENLERKVMLIVDDIQMNRTALASYFKQEFNIVEADNGKVAYEFIEENFDKIDIILLDLIMPVMDGFELLKRLKKNKLYANIPVIVTSQTGEVSETRSFELGANDFIGKPYDMEVAVHRVQNVLANNTVKILEREKIILKKMKELALEAKLDPLTRLFNRVEMEKRVGDYLEQTDGSRGVFIMMDVDNFKNVNDTFGHAKGDEVLQKVAHGLMECFRSEDILCRIGGDEFAAFIKADLGEQEIHKRLQRMSQRMEFLVEDLKVTCSIGASVAPHHGKEYQVLYEHADQALFQTKRDGKNGYSIYQE